jgi:hypothetical protein
MPEPVVPVAPVVPVVPDMSGCEYERGDVSVDGIGLGAVIVDVGAG